MTEREEHRIIYLEPGCCSEAGEDRHWCQDDAWEACDECGTKSVKYIIASEHEALVKALKDLVHAARHQPIGMQVMNRARDVLARVVSPAERECK